MEFNLNNFPDAIRKDEAFIGDTKSWMQENKLKLNDDKTEVLIITSASQAHTVTCRKLKIAVCYITTSKTAKKLGATFDDTFSFDAHLENLAITSFERSGVQIYS